MKEKRRIDWESGNGAIIFGVSVMCMALILGLCVGDLFCRYHAVIYAQTRADLMADAAAEYSLIGYGYGLNEPGFAAGKAQSLIEKNNEIGQYELVASIDASALGDPEFSAKTHVYTVGEYIFPSIMSQSYFTVEADAETQILMADKGEEIIPLDTSKKVNPVYATAPGNRSGVYMKYVLGQFNILENARYSGNQAVTFLWDYSVAMGCEIPVLNSDGSRKDVRELADWFESASGAGNGWAITDAKGAADAANQGSAVILIYKTSGRGLVVMPGSSADAMKVMDAGYLKSVGNTDSGYAYDGSAAFYVHS